MEDKNLTAGLEDYLEAIYVADIEKKEIKGAQLARMLNISRASVSEALSKLVSKGLIQYESYGTVTLTPKGIYNAKKVYQKHNILKSFFKNVLGISPDEASENACKIEHIVSQNILNEMINFTNFCDKNPDVIDKYKEYKNEV